MVGVGGGGYGGVMVGVMVGVIVGVMVCYIVLSAWLPKYICLQLTFMLL